MSLIDRRAALVSAAAGLIAGCDRAQAQPKALTVYKTESCGCCNGWIAHMQKAGYTTKVVNVGDIGAVSSGKGIPAQLSSCHVGEAGGYALVGHIPPADIDRLLKERPKAVGLTVPGMPVGSPGMETPSGEKEAYDVLLVLPGGNTRVWARHA